MSMVALLFDATIYCFLDHFRTISFFVTRNLCISLGNTDAKLLKNSTISYTLLLFRCFQTLQKNADQRRKTW